MINLSLSRTRTGCFSTGYEQFVSQLDSDGMWLKCLILYFWVPQCLQQSPGRSFLLSVNIIINCMDGV